MSRVIFEKRDGKYDAMFVERGGALEEIACPKQPPIPHDMFHYAIERVLEMRGFIRRAAGGEGVGFVMAREAESEAVERLVETMQADSWSGRPPASEVIDLFHTTCDARGTTPITLTEEAIVAIRSEIDRLAVEWSALPTRGRMTLEI
ncbi:hypothetical protein [Candidatus Viadribacter manganicus]|uniref:Uncharacterized protein n=1 Tax=Candidatus Viadribacter manganicus TaxID=1759059 RepID=A0A1B1AE96_9PROT|nr:hypothetical protein [Candidatus Viadribacter manganicus]ANP44879.1 hypothetical protein ATE48_02535 [Candidatus Viadribacter manganicus]